MKDKMNLIFGTIAIVALVAIAGLLAAEAFDDDDDEVKPGAIPVADTRPANTAIRGVDDMDEVAQLDSGQIVDADDTPLSKGELERAEAAALRVAGGGVVTDIDRSDDINEAYEVEVVSDAGEVDIALDGRFQRVPNLRYDD